MDVDRIHFRANKGANQALQWSHVLMDVDSPPYGLINTRIYRFNGATS